jgi:hypothetical protein
MNAAGESRNRTLQVMLLLVALLAALLFLLQRYGIKGDKLTICDRGEDNGERPASFDETPNAGLVMIIFQRPHQ